LEVQLARITLTLLVYGHHGSKINRMFCRQLAQLNITYLCPQNPVLRRRHFPFTTMTTWLSGRVGL